MSSEENKEITLEWGKMKKFSVKTKVSRNLILSLSRQLGVEMKTKIGNRRLRNAQSCAMAVSPNSKRISRKCNRSKSRHRRGEKDGYSSKRRRSARSKGSKEPRSR